MASIAPSLCTLPLSIQFKKKKSKQFFFKVIFFLIRHCQNINIVDLIPGMLPIQEFVVGIIQHQGVGLAVTKPVYTAVLKLHLLKKKSKKKKKKVQFVVSRKLAGRMWVPLGFHYKFDHLSKGIYKRYKFVFFLN